MGRKKNKKELDKKLIIELLIIILIMYIMPAVFHSQLFYLIGWALLIVLYNKSHKSLYVKRLIIINAIIFGIWFILTLPDALKDGILNNA